MSDSVEHPSHYNAGGVETIEGIKAALGDGFSDYCLGNVLKYVWRCKHKGKLVEDLRKAAKYLEWAIEESESNCPETPDSSSGEPLAIPDGWRELEPDEIPLATDMHEYMGGWHVRKHVACNEYKWYDARHIRKIGTDEPKPLAIPEGWRELEPDEVPKTGDEVDIDGQWVDLLSDWNVEYRYYSTRMIRKIEPSNPNEPQPLAIPHGWRELEPDEVPLATDMHEWMGGWFYRNTETTHQYKFHGSRHIRKIEIDEPKPLAIPEGWRELEIGEALSKNDLYCRDGKWNPYVESNPAGSDFPRYSKGIHYKHIRKIETANPSEAPNSSQWIPKVGDKVRVNKPGRIAHGKVGVIVEGDAGEYEVRIERENLRSCELKAEHLKLIEAAQ